jgi:hypothetical protein
MAIVAGGIGAFIAGLGMLGILDPAKFMELVTLLQTSTMIYAAAALRIVLGIGLIASARASRWPGFLRLLGGIIFIAGMVTPFGGAWLGRTLLDLWPSWGPAVVRGWGAMALSLGVAVVFSVMMRRTTPRPAG